MFVPTRFVSRNGAGTANQNETFYTVPAGKVALVTQISVVAAGGPLASHSLYIASGGAGYGGCLAQSIAIPQSAQRLSQGFYVLPAGESIVAVNDVPNNAWIMATGLLGDVADTFEGGALWRAVAYVTATGDNTFYTSTGKTSVVKTVVTSNVSASVDNTSAVRIGATPIVPYFGSIPRGGSSSSTQQVDGSWLALPGDTLIANINSAATPGAAFYAAGVSY